MHRKFSLLSAFLIMTLTTAVHAQIREFPYQARVVEDGVYVRSGVVSGEPYYPTQRLRKDEIVTVLRHDPGGWYQIEPPEGSFSWVAEEYVRRTSGDKGEVAENNIVAFVGSEFGDETSVWQRLLRSGEQVTILGQKQVDTADGAKAMYRIAPPKREYRWIPGSSVIPVGDSLLKQHDKDPFRVPSNARRPTTAEQTSVSNADTARTTSQGPPTVRPSPQLARLQQIRKEQQQLKEIDERFRKMLLSDPTDWDLDDIETEYRMLQEAAVYKPLAGQIDLRYPAIERYRQRRAEFTEFKRLTSQTEQRDAQLLAAQYGIEPSTLVASVIPRSTGFGGEQILLTDDSISPAAQPSLSTPLQPFPDANFLQAPTDVPFADTFANTRSPLLNIPQSSRYIGAGILQRSASAEGDTQFVLATPSGRVLAHVANKGDVDLEPYVGQPVGLHGSRWFRDDIKSDFIEVSGLEAVKLRR